MQLKFAEISLKFKIKGQIMECNAYTKSRSHSNVDAQS